MSILDVPPVVRVRRNHALEHATMHVLSQHQRTLRLMGRSSLSGFFIYGQVDTEALAAAASEALVRLQNGEVDLAVHTPVRHEHRSCGCSGCLSTFGVMLGRARSKWDRRHRRFCSDRSRAGGTASGGWVQSKILRHPMYPAHISKA